MTDQKRPPAPTELTDRYRMMPEAEWFKQAHDGKSLGESMPVTEEQRAEALMLYEATPDNDHALVTLVLSLIQARDTAFAAGEAREAAWAAAWAAAVAGDEGDCHCYRHIGVLKPEGRR